MLDPKVLRETPEVVRAAIAKKHLDVDVDAVLALDRQFRTRKQQYEEQQAKLKEFGQKISVAKGISAEEFEKAKRGAEEFKKTRDQFVDLKELEEKWQAAMLTLPNVPHASVPEGAGPDDNVIYSIWGFTPSQPMVGCRAGEVADVKPLEKFDPAQPHWEIKGFENLLDFGRGAKVTGAGFPFYVGDGAKIVRALLQFFLDEDVKAGYTEVAPPIFVNAASATATGQLPDKEGQMYETTPDRLFAVPTAEVPLTNFFRDEIVEESALPIKRCAYTPCFRREAGSYGKDVRGLNRLHQFDKVELLKWVHPTRSYEELDALRDDAERLLRKLELPYRVLLMCGGDLGFSQSKKYDLEVWAAGQKRWLEVSSCSNFEAFQARRAQIRFRNQETGKPELVHTLNGSGLAVPRVLAALLENNLQADGRVKIPAALVPYFGKEFLSFK